MPISNFYNHEANWESSLRSVIASGGTSVPTANIQIAQSLTYSGSPRIEIEVESDARASDQMAQIPGGQWFFSHRECVAAIRIVTQRTAATAQDHGTMRARCRYLLSREAQALISPAVTLYTVLNVQEQPSSVYVRDPDGDREDVTEIRHRIEYGIFASVVPTT